MIANQELKICKDGDSYHIPTRFACEASIKDSDGSWKITMDHHNHNQVETPNAAAVPDGARTKESTCQCRRHKVQSLDWKEPLEKEMAPHSTTLDRRIPWTEETGVLQSMGLQRVGHD